ALGGSGSAARAGGSRHGQGSAAEPGEPSTSAAKAAGCRVSGLPGPLRGRCVQPALRQRKVQPLRPPRRQHGPHHAARLRLARVVRLGRRVGRRPGVVFAEPAADAGGGGVSALGVQGEALRLVWVKM
ncbi:unnamed protein product, partial [Effrenium voratum]